VHSDGSKVDRDGGRSPSVDILAHALYGATLCSRTGLAGGRRGTAVAGASFSRDWTVWTAAGFGILPDMTSIGISFIQTLILGEWPSFHAIPPYVFVLYHCSHSLVVAGLFLLLLRAMVAPTPNVNAMPCVTTLAASS
jgi:hypothetical protein